MSDTVLDTSISGRLKNTASPKTQALLTLYEAVVNSIQAIEEIYENDMEKGMITIHIERALQTQIDLQEATPKRGPETKADITGFSITDNGIGFNEANFISFKTLDSEYKASKGCRGIGRLLWLKAFDSVHISSTYNKDSIVVKREFDFNASQQLHNISETETNEAKIETTVLLKGFKERYQRQSKKTVSAIANDLLEHCLWYYIRDGGAPRIFIIDEDEKISIDSVYENQMVSKAVPDKLTIKKQDFDLIHIKFSPHLKKTHCIAFCAGNRLVKEEKLSGVIPGLFGQLNDGETDFIYGCYVRSEFLNEAVRAERTGFNIEDDNLDLFDDTEISLQDIRNAVFINIKHHLKTCLEKNKAEGRERVESFVNSLAPRYKSIVSRIPEEELIVDPSITDKELELLLHKHYATFESECIADGHDVLKPNINDSEEQYYAKIEAYLTNIKDLKQSDLANYVAHRRVILDLYNMAIVKQDNGKYAREELIHQLIMPMRKDTRDISMDNCNLWLVDERLAFHNYLASDKTLFSLPFTGSEDKLKCDLISYNVFDNPILFNDDQNRPLASITIVEIKRPMRNDYKEGEDKDPIEQSLDYLEKVREGKCLINGRPIVGSAALPGFCYILADLTPTMIKRCRLKSLIMTSDGQGFFGFNPDYKAYIEVISFDRVGISARERNRAFFDKLGLPS